MTYPFVIDPEFQSRNDPLTEEERTSLTEKIKTEGPVKDSLTTARIDGTDNLIDGHHTFKICEELQIPLPEPRFLSHVTTREQVIEWIDQTEGGRRKPSIESRRRKVGYWHEKGWSGMRIAELLGVSEATVRRDVEECSGPSHDGPELKVVGKDGRMYPANKTKERLKKIIPEIVNAVAGGLFKEEDAAKLHKLDRDAQLMCWKMVLQDKTHATLAEAMKEVLAPSDDDIPLDGKKQTPGEKPPPSEKELAQAAGMSVGEYRCWKEVEAKGCDKLVAAVKKKTVKTKDAWAILKQAPDFQEYALELFEEGDKKSLVKAIEGIEKLAKDGCPALITAVMEKKSIKLSEAEKILNDPKPIQERALTLYLAAVEAKDDKGPKSLKQAIGKVVICKNCLKAVRKHEDPPKDCTDCKLLQPKKKDKSGNVLFDDKIITDLMGKLSRAVDQRGSAIGKTAEYDRVGMVLDDLEAAWRQWRSKSS